MLYVNLIQSSTIFINEDTVYLYFKNPISDFSNQILNKEENKLTISTQIEKICGKKMNIKLLDDINNKVYDFFKIQEGDV